MLLEKEIATKAREAEVSALRTENQELREEVQCLKQIQGEVEGMMMEREAEFLELEEAWTKEKDELMRAAELSAAQHTAEVAELTKSLEAMRVECASRGTEFRVLVEAKEHLETTHTKHEEKILELTDKLSEYSRLTRKLTAKGTPESSPLPALCEREPPQKFPRVLETKSATTSPRRRQHPPRSPRKET
jgi:chromosome segregation ATPase